MRVVIAGGGTGGHLFPGIAIAKAFLRKNSNTSIMFIGTIKGIEKKIVPREGFRINYITTSGFKNRSILEKIISLIEIPLSIIQSMIYLIGFRPDIVVGIGGYASGSVGISSYLLRIPLVIQEQNIIPGVTNKILGKFATKVFTSFEDTAKYFTGKTEYTGNPIREEIAELGNEKITQAKEEFSILVMGGSQGASSINNAIVSALEFLKSIKHKLEITIQTGEMSFEKILKAANVSGFNIKVYPFIEDMPQAYKKADLVISRSGATTLAEITASGRAAMLIPFPFAADNHQELNALELVRKGAAIMVHNRDLTGKRIADEILNLVNNRAKLFSMMEESKKNSNPDAAWKIVKRCYELTGKKYV
jgi:UDP-N-acetylglucosamine--N-acetylmuramyl-(pentapeptide) pyrophosphoryl-undecaprenol N-acetylglucosamine transferase